MVAGETLTLTLTGGGPWGFRLQGGDNQPIRIAKIRKKSKAHSGGVQEGDTIVNINGEPMAGKTHQGAMDLVDSAEDTLCLQIIRGTISQPAEELQKSPQDVVMGEKKTASDIVIGGHSDVPESTVVQSFTSSHTESDGKTTRNVVTETRTETSDGKSNQSFVQHETISTAAETPVSFFKYQESGEPFMPNIVENQTVNESTDENIAPTQQVKGISMPVFNVKNVKKDLSSPHEPGETATVSKENIMPSFNVRNVRSETIETHSSKSIFDPLTEKTEKSPAMVFHVKNVKDGALYKNQPPPVMAKPKRKPLKMALGENVPQFNVKNVADRPGGVWQPNVTVTASTKSTYHETPLSEVDRSEQTYHSLPSLFDQLAPPDHMGGDHAGHRPGHLHIFGPPVEFHPQEGDFPSLGSEPGTPDTTSTGWSKRKLYADSAFYDDHDESYPTIDEQMKLCKIIANSLTSNVNKRARGARMFARRKKKSATWVHQGQSGFSSEKSSSTGDVADLHDLESELSPADGGIKPLFSFRIPSVAVRVTPAGGPSGKMTLSQDEFENLRLTKSKCDHRSVSPNTCFSIVEDLQSSKGKGSRMFQKRLARSEKWVVDETNAKKPPGYHEKTKLEDLLMSKSKLSPWDAASSNQYGMVDDAFRHLSDNDRMQKIKEQLETKYKKTGPVPPMATAPIPASTIPDFQLEPSHQHKLESQYDLKLLECQDFNRLARGWGSQRQPMPTQVSAPPESEPTEPQQPPPPPAPKSILKRNYNPTVKGWSGAQDNYYPQQNGTVSNQNSLSYQQAAGNFADPHGGHVADHQYQATMLPGCDL